MQRKVVSLILSIATLLSLVVTGAVGAAGPMPGPSASGVILTTDSASSTLVLYENTGATRTYVANAETFITSASGAKLVFADLSTGQRAQVSFVEQENVLIATRVVVTAATWGQRVLYGGYVVALDDVAKSLTVRNPTGQLTFQTNGATTYWGLTGYDALALDQYVSVQAIWQNTYWLAESVSLVRPPRVELKGTVTAIDRTAGTLSLRTALGDLTVKVNAQTVFTKNQQTVTFADLLVGDSVTARLVWLPDGTWLAKWVNILPMPPTVFEGRVTEKLADRFSVATVTPRSTVTTPVTFLVNDATVYMQGGIPVSYDQVVVGAYVRVQANRQQDESWLATKVVIVKPPRVEFRGVVTEIGADRFTIDTLTGLVTFLVDAATIFEDCGVPATFADLAVGDTVKVYAVSVPTATREMVWLAKKVCILPPPVVDFAGVVATKEAESFVLRTVIGEVTFQVNAETEFVKGGAEVSYDALQVGDRVRVKAVQQADGAWLAKRVNILLVQICIRGTVTDKQATQFTLRSAGVLYTFTVNDATVFEKLGVEAPSYADLQVNDGVVVNAVQQSDGTWLATRVKIIVQAGPTP